MKIYCAHCGFGNEIVGGIKPSTCSKCKKSTNQKVEIKSSIFKNIPVVTQEPTRSRFIQENISEEDEELSVLEDLNIGKLNVMIDAENRFEASSFSFGDVAGSNPNEKFIKPKRKKVNAKVALREIMNQAKQSISATEV